MRAVVGGDGAENGGAEGGSEGAVGGKEAGSADVDVADAAAFDEARRELHAMHKVLAAFAGIRLVREKLTRLLLKLTAKFESALKRRAEANGRQAVDLALREVCRLPQRSTCDLVHTAAQLCPRLLLFFTVEPPHLRRCCALWGSRAWAQHTRACGRCCRCHWRRWR